jgi:hypothetical protein
MLNKTKTPNTLDVALSYLATNPDCFLFPITKLAKYPPCFDDNLKRASNDPAQIKKWAARFPGCNWGLACAKSNRIVVDVDRKEGKVGQRTFDDLDLDYGFPPTRTVDTPSGGLHLYYRCEPGQHVNALGKSGFGLDVDSTNYVLIPGCELASGGSYRDAAPLLHKGEEGNGEDTPCPDWFWKFLRKREKTEHGPDAAAVVEEDQSHNIEWAIHFLKNDADPAIEGRGGELTTLKTAMALRDHGISRTQAKMLMADHYNIVGTCDPLWADTDLDKKVDNAYDYANINAPGSATAEAQFAADDPYADETDEERILREQKEKAAQEKNAKLPKRAPGDDFIYYRPENKCIYLPTGDMWPRESVSASTKKGTLLKITKERHVSVMTWAPGHPQIIYDKIVNQDWIEHPGANTYNLYRPAIIKGGVAKEAKPWREHLRNLYPTDAEYMENWFAHRVQRPGDKINSALVMGGPTRTGKDTILEPVKYAVGPHNFVEITASQAMEPKFNAFLQAVILRVSEARDFGDKNRYSFYEHWKPWLAAPPDVLMVADKNVKAHPIFNCFGQIVTSNHKYGGLYLPSDDARNYVAWSEIVREMILATFGEDYFDRLWRWYAVTRDKAGLRHVAQFLSERDLSKFNPKAPPPLTEAWHAMVQSHMNTADQELGDVIERMPPILSDEPTAPVEAFTASQLHDFAFTHKFYSVADSLTGVKAMTALPRRLGDHGFEAMMNRGAKDGRWKVGGRHADIYARRALPMQQRLAAVDKVIANARKKAVAQ